MKQQKQLGFAHLGIVVIILTMALVGALGFIFYQNFIQSKSNTKASNNTQLRNNENAKATTPTVEDDKNTFKITEWGVKGTYKGIHPISYSITTHVSNLSINNADVASFSSSDVTGICAQTGFGSIARATGDTTMGVNPQYQTTVSKYSSEHPNLVKKVGDYYFVFLAPHQGCTTSENDNDPNVKITSQIESDLNKYTLTLESI